MQPINLQLASYSDLFMLIAALVYAAAFVLFALDMANSSRTIRTLEAELAADTARRRQAQPLGALDLRAVEAPRARRGVVSDQNRGVRRSNLQDAKTAPIRSRHVMVSRAASAGTRAPSPTRRSSTRAALRPVRR